MRAECAGVLFTAHPVTGQRDRIVISAAWGLGEAVVSGQVTPDTIVVGKARGQVLARETATKEVMTVLLESGTQEQVVPESLRGAPVLSDKRATELARLGTQIEALYGVPMDVEWAWSGAEFAILQARPITALPSPSQEGAPEPPVPVLPESSLPHPTSAKAPLIINATIVRIAIPSSLSPTRIAYHATTAAVRVCGRCVASLTVCR